MAKPPDPFHEFVRELLASMAPLEIKRMFGGAGVYASGVMFGLIGDDELYLKVDDALKEALSDEGSEAFTFEMKDGKTAQLGYWRMPSAAMDDSDEATEWGRKALSVALKAAKAKPKRKPKSKPKSD